MMYHRVLPYKCILLLSPYEIKTIRAQKWHFGWCGVALNTDMATVKTTIDGTPGKRSRRGTWDNEVMEGVCDLPFQQPVQDFHKKWVLIASMCLCALKWAYQDQVRHRLYTTSGEEQDPVRALTILD